MSEFHFYISGKVTVHPEAAIASDVLLQADPDSHLIIAAGVCIGSGSILHAYQGTLEIESGATLGTKVLVIGSGRIGAKACIGAMSTICESSIDAEQVIPPNSLISKRSDIHSDVREESDQPSEMSADAASPAASSSAPSTTNEASSEENLDLRQSHIIYGQASFNRMMLALFPHRQSLNHASQPNPPTEGNT
jgi:carbon dioxide concentrating mechanism protein CcmN